MNNWFLLAAIPVFGLCVLVHEFGHFITAKWAGIRVEEFGLGFPPRLVGFRKRDSGGWEVIWFGGRRNAEDSYDAEKQSPFSGTSGGYSTAFPGTKKHHGAYFDEGVRRSNFYQEVSSDEIKKHHTIYSINFLPIG